MRTISILAVTLVILIALGFRDNHSLDVIHDDTLKGDGVSVPLGINVPLTLKAPATTGTSVLNINTNTTDGGLASFSNGTGEAIYGEANNSTAILGNSDNKTGIAGNSINGTGVSGISGNVGVYAENNQNTGSHAKAYLGARCCAGDFYGNVYIHGRLDVEGAKHFMIDDPIDPSNKYLYHASVESSDMKNIYDGIAVLDMKGEAVVIMPEWFDALNKDFRYQLTAIGAPMPGLFIAQEIKNNSFKISGGKPGNKVSWMLTGIRQDAWAKANPLKVEQKKPENEKGTYLHPELFGASKDKSVEKARYPNKN